MRAVIFAEDALASTDRLWSDAVAHLARKLGRVTPLDPGEVPQDRAAALDYLERWGRDGAGGWRVEVARFYEDHMPLYVRPNPVLNAAVRRLEAESVLLGTWSPGPPQTAMMVTQFLGLARRFQSKVVDPRPDAAARVAAELGVAPADTLVVSASPRVLAESTLAGARTAAALWTGRNRDRLLAAQPSLLAESPDDLIALA